MDASDLGMVPAEPPQLLPGRSAWYWVHRSTFSILGAGLCAPGMLVGALIGPPVRQFLVVGALAGLLTFAIVAIHAAVNQVQAERRERDAGYTTLYGRDKRRYWHLDHKTGLVIRRPLEATRPRNPS